MKRVFVAVGLRCALDLRKYDLNGSNVSEAVVGTAATNPGQPFRDKLASMRATCASSERLATGHICCGTSS